MKRLLEILVIITYVVPAYSQNLCEIKGILKSNKPTSVCLFKTTLGRLDTVAMAKPAADGTFGFSFKPEAKGYYSIGSAINAYRLYFKPGDKASVMLNDTMLTLTGRNTKENIALYEWDKKYRWLHHMAVNFMMKGNYTYLQIFPELEKVKKEGDTFIKTVNTGNASFDNLLRKTVRYDIDYAALMTLFTPRTSHPKEEEYPAVVKNIATSKLYDNDEILEQPYGVSMLNLLAMYKITVLKYDFKDFDKIIASTAGNLSKAELIISRAGRFKTYSDYANMESKYGNLFTLKDQKERMAAIRSKLLVYKEGTPAYDFAYPDAAGKVHALSDYKGKVVLVDVWATWCGPCKKEIPALLELEKKYHGTDVVFMSVSVDEKKDYDKWKTFVKEHGMGGLQLFAEGWSKITKDYRITGIPRFMLFDKEGKIISVDAPRPSMPELSRIIDEQLAK